MLKNYLRKTFLLIVLLSLLSTSVFAMGNSYSNIKDENTLIEQYFEQQKRSLIENNENEASKLKKFFYQVEENCYCHYEIGRLKYFIKSSKIAGDKILDYKYNLEFVNKEYSGNDIVVDVIVNKQIYYDYLKAPCVDKTLHRITISRTNNSYLISKDEYVDEFSLLFDKNTDFNKLIDNLENQYHQFKRSNLEQKNSDLFYGTSIVIMGEPGDSYDYFSSSERANAVYYARMYTDDTGTCDGSNYNNDKFKYFSYANDCQNYVSQCIWYGFGGRSSSNKDYPMHSEWWADTNSTSPTWQWTGTSYFYNEITSNNNNNGYGIQAFSTTPSNIMEGDYIYVPGHVVYVTKADDSDGDGVVEYNEIEICAHTNNRKDRNLASLYGSVPPCDMKFMHIVRIKWNTAMEMN